MSAPASSMKSVVAALSANVLITVSKFVAFGFSGSGAMLSEAIHSAADAGNQLLLFLGLKRAARENDPEFNYGFGAERFVFGILSAAGIFFIGCGVTVYHGIVALVHPHPPEVGPITFIVLGVSFVLEGYSMSVAARGIYRQKGEHGFFEYLFHYADPAAAAIILEDTAALLGLLLAAGGIGLTWATGNPTWDALGSVLVGILLGLIAWYLAKENRELLLGKAVPHEIADRFKAVVAGTPGVRDVHDVKTRQLTPESFKLKAEISIDEAFLAKRLAEVLAAHSPALDRAAASRALAEAAVLAISDVIDDVEARVSREIPEAHHIDLEVDHTDEKQARAAASRATGSAAA